MARTSEAREVPEERGNENKGNVAGVSSLLALPLFARERENRGVDLIHAPLAAAHAPGTAGRFASSREFGRLVAFATGRNATSGMDHVFMSESI
jgi:hypothetical protein